MMRRYALLAAAAAGALVVSALPAQAGTTFTTTTLSAQVDADGHVTASTTMKATTSTTVAEFGVCARSPKAQVDFLPRLQNVAITTDGTTATGAQVLEPGTYTYFACIRVKNWDWRNIGEVKSFTVPASSATPTVAPSPSASITPTPSAPTATGTPSPTTGPASGTLLFSDDFSGAAGAKPDASKWGEWSYATFNGAAAYGNIMAGERSTLDGQGHLSIPATPKVGTSISTKDDFSFTYGTMTARMMIPKASGYWPAFWSLNGPPNGASTPLGGEVDAIEAYTQFSDGYRVGAHDYVNSVDVGPAGGAPLVGGRDIRGAWHDYGARIEPNKITYLFDGVPVASFSSSSSGVAGEPWAFGPTAQNWMLLTNAIGSANQAAPTQNSTLLVDRVEVRAL
jgi:beta-glucanase (GH16 family)